MCSSYNLDPEPYTVTGDTLTVIINTSMSILQDNQQNYPFISYTFMKISIGEVPPCNGSDKHSKKSSWNVLIAIIIKTVQPQDSAGHGAGVHALPCLNVPGDIGDKPVHKPEDFRVNINS